MENNIQNRPPQKKNIPFKDLMLIALTVFVIFLVDWKNMNSFHYLIIFLLLLCFMLRWSNMRKDAQQKEAMAQRKAAEEAARLIEDAPKMITDNEAVSAEGTPAEDASAAEKTE